MVRRGRRDVPPLLDPEPEAASTVPDPDPEGAMVISGRRRQVRVLKHHVEEDRNFLLFATLGLGVIVMAIVLWYSTP